MIWKRARGVPGTMSSDELSEPTDAEIHAFMTAWDQERQKIGRGIAPKGTKTRAGLRAAYAVQKQRLAEAYEERTGNQIPSERTADVTFDQRMRHLDIIDAAAQVAGITSISDHVEWLRTNLRIQHEQTKPTQEQSQDLDPRPWSITHGAGAFTAGARLRDSRAIHPAARFVFDPRDQYEQDASKYPAEEYGASWPVGTSRTSEEAAALAWDTIKQATIRTAAPAAEITDDEIREERFRQMERGYSARHDDEHGLRHLLLWAVQYGKRGKAVESLALIRAALESMARKGQDL